MLKEWPSDEEWSGPYEIVHVGSTKPGSIVENAENDYKHQREMSDV
jgi:hypothetical protein